MDSFTLQTVVPIIARLYVSQVPIYIVGIIGLRLAIQMVQRHRPGARIVLWAIATQLMTSIIFTPLLFLVSWTLMRSGIDSVIGNNIGTGLGLLSTSINAIAWIVMLVALIRPSTLLPQEPNTTADYQ